MSHIANMDKKIWNHENLQTRQSASNENRYITFVPVISHLLTRFTYAASETDNVISQMNEMIAQGTIRSGLHSGPGQFV